MNSQILFELFLAMDVAKEWALTALVVCGTAIGRATYVITPAAEVEVLSGQHNPDDSNEADEPNFVVYCLFLG